jgi:4-amino-4-deoxy-L-arabinose transferase-like glycosyltransferase
MDHDESTYIVIADALRQGQVYLRDVIDTKPIGIFALFALFQTLFGKSILAIRIMTSVWIALTAWILYLLHARLLDQKPEAPFNPAPIASGVIYIFMTSIFTFFGISPNTEIFFVLFTVAAFYIVLTHEGFGWFFLAGLLLGLGFMIKYVVLFDAVAIGLFYIWQQVQTKRKWYYWFSRCAVMAISFGIPFSAIWLYYVSLGMDDTFRFFTFELSGRYFIDSLWQANLTFTADCLLRFFPVTFWCIYCSFHWRITGKRLPVFSWLWGVLVMVIILMPGRFYYHYFIQMMVPMSLLAGSFFDQRRSPGPALAWMRNPSFGYPILAVAIVVNVLFQKSDYFDKSDYPREAASWISERLKPGEVIYTGNYHQIIYHLTGTSSPTPYEHSSLIWSPKNSEALRIDPLSEWNKILDKNPRFICLGKTLPEDHLMVEGLRQSYQLVKNIGTVAKIYERK